MKPGKDNNSEPSPKTGKPSETSPDEKSKTESLSSEGKENDVSGSKPGIKKKSSSSNSSGKAEIKGNKGKKKRAVVIVIAIVLIILALLFIGLKSLLINELKALANKNVNGSVEVQRIEIGWSEAYLEGVEIHSNHNDTPIKAKKIIVKYYIPDILKKPYGHKLVKSVDVYEPDILLYTKEGVEWNLFDLFNVPRPKKEPVVLQLDFPARIHNGKFQFVDFKEKGFTASAVSINGMLKFNPGKASSVEVELTSVEDNAKITARGKLNQKFTGLDIRIKAEGLSASHWMSYILRGPAVKFNSGKIDADVSLLSEDVVSSPDILEALDIGGSANVEYANLELSILPDPLKNISGKVTLTKDKVGFKDIKATYRNFPLTCQGSLVNLTKPVAHIYITIPLVSLNKMKNQPVLKSSPVDLSGDVSAKIGIHGFLDSPKIDGTIKFSKIKAKNEIIKDGNVNFSYFNDSVNIDLINSKWGDGTMKGMAWVNTGLKHPSFFARLKGINANVGKAAKLFFPDYNIAAISDFDVKIIGNTKDQVILGKSNLSGVEYSDSSLGNGNADFIYNDQVLLLKKYNLTGNGGNISGKSGLLDIQNKYLDFGLNAKNYNFPTHIIPSLKQVTIRSDAVARVFGYFSSPIVRGAFSDASIDYQDKKLRKTSGSILYGHNFIFLKDGSTTLDNSRFNVDGWTKLDKKISGQIVYSSDSILLSNLGSIVPSMKSLKSTKPFDVAGFVQGKDNNFGWTIVADGSLGNIAGFGRYINSKESDFSANMLGWNVDLDEFIPHDQQKTIKPGRGDFLILAKGNKSRFDSDFITRTDNGKAMGLPINLGRGSFTYRGGVLNFSDTAFSGFQKDKGKDVRFANLKDLYKISSYWGIDYPISDNRTTFSRMYNMPFMLEGATYTVDGWQMTVIKPINIVSANSLSGRFSAVRGLPTIWNIENFRQLKEKDDTGYPISVSFKNNGRKNIANRIPVYNAKINGKVDLNSKSMDLDIKSNSINIESLWEKIDLSTVGVSIDEIKKVMEWNRIEGTAQLDGKVLGYWTSPRWDGRIDVNDGILNHESFTFNSNLQIDGKGLNFKHFHLTQSIGRYNGSGRIDFRPDVTFDMKLEAKDGKLERLLSFTPWKDIPARGLLSGNIKVQGNLKAPRFNGDLFVENANIFKQPISSITLKMKSGIDTINLEEISAAVNGSKITGSGKMQKSRLDFQLKSEKFPLSKLEILTTQFRKVSGDSSFSLDIKGTSQSPIYSLDFAANKFQLGNQDFEKASGKIHWENNELRMSPLSLETIDAYWRTDGSVMFPRGKIPMTWDEWSGKTGRAPVFNVESKLKNWKLTKILDLTNHPIKDKLEGTLEGNLHLTGSFPYPAFDMDLHTYNGRIEKNKYESIDFYLSYKKGILEMKEFEYISPESHAFLSGEINKDDRTMTFSGDIKNLPASIFHPFIPQSKFIEGSIDSAIFLSGDYEKPDMVSNTSIKSGKLGNLNFDEISGHFTAEKGIISFDDLAIQKNKQKITFKGKVPVSLKDASLEFPEDMEIETRIKEKNLDVLTIFLPYIKETSGSINANLSITGKYPNVKIQGDGHIKNGKIQTTLMENPIENLKVDTTFHGKQLTVPKFTGKMGNGIFNLTGFARWDKKKLQISEMRFILLGKDLLVLMPGLVKGLVDTKITLTGSQQSPMIGKTQYLEGYDYLTLKNANLTMPDGQLKSFSQILPKPEKNKDKKGKSAKKDSKNEKTEKEEQPSIAIGFPLIYNFKFSMGKDVWFDYKGLYIKSSGDLEIFRKKDQNIRIFGELDFSKGSFQLPLMTTSFNNAKGTVYFHGGDPTEYDKNHNPTDYTPNPNFSMEARTKVSNVDIFMTYNGSLEDLKTSFQPDSKLRANLDIYSIPPFDQKQILEMLVSSTFIGSVVNPDTETGGASGDSNLQSTGINILANYLQSVFLTPITRKFGRAFALSSISFSMGTQGSWNFVVSKALDPNDKFYLTYTQSKRIQGETVGIWGLEYAYRPDMRLRVENEEDAFRYLLQGHMIFDNGKEFFNQLFEIFNFSSGKDKKKKK